MIEQFLEIGFVKTISGGGTYPGMEEYKYYPPYFTDKHYTLVTYDGMITEYFTKKTRPYRDYRLYIHQNIDGRLAMSFQTSDVEYVQQKFDKLFSICGTKN